MTESDIKFCNPLEYHPSFVCFDKFQVPKRVDRFLKEGRILRLKFKR